MQRNELYISWLDILMILSFLKFHGQICRKFGRMFEKLRPYKLICFSEENVLKCKNAIRLCNILLDLEFCSDLGQCCAIVTSLKGKWILMIIYLYINRFIQNCCYILYVLFLHSVKYIIDKRNYM